ncbi:hypothetical protein [Leptolyngbya phage Lbo-JY46]
MNIKYIKSLLDKILCDLTNIKTNVINKVSLLFNDELVEDFTKSINFTGNVQVTSDSEGNTEVNIPLQDIPEGEFIPLPEEGTNGQVLTTDGAGTYTWENNESSNKVSFYKLPDIPNLNLSSGIPALDFNVKSILPANEDISGKYFKLKSYGRFTNLITGVAFTGLLRILFTNTSGSVFDNNNSYIASSFGNGTIPAASSSAGGSEFFYIELEMIPITNTLFSVKATCMRSWGTTFVYLSRKTYNINDPIRYLVIPDTTGEVSLTDHYLSIEGQVSFNTI